MCDRALDEFELLVRQSLVWDAHAGIFPDPRTDLSGITAWREAGVDYVSINVGYDVIDWQTTFRTLTAYRTALRQMPETVCVIRTIEDILAARQQNKLAVSFDIEGANALDGDPGMVSAYYDLGVRQMLLAYNLGNKAAGGCHDGDTGLTSFGREIVMEMNRVGMLVDCSHASMRTTLDMMQVSSRPVVFTHSNPAAIRPHERNILDEQIKLCAATGGVIGINGMGIFLAENDNSSEVFANHICHIADLVGPEHVGFGLDYKPPSKHSKNFSSILQARPDYWPASQGYGTRSIKLVSPEQLPRICQILSSRGWANNDLRGFLGENFLRVARAVWK